RTPLAPAMPTSPSRTPSASAERTPRSSSGATTPDRMASSPLDRTLHFVVGKGGVGKTTVSAALALNLARAGKRTLAIEMDTGGRLAAVLGIVEDTMARPVRVERRLHTLAIDGRHALEEYLGMLIPVKRLLSTVFQSRIYQYFVAAAPGLKELMTVGKI